MQDGIRRFCQQLTFDEKKKMVKMHNDYLQKTSDMPKSSETARL